MAREASQTLKDISDIVWPRYGWVSGTVPRLYVEPSLAKLHGDMAFTNICAVTPQVSENRFEEGLPTVIIEWSK